MTSTADGGNAYEMIFRRLWITGCINVLNMNMLSSV